MSEQDKRERTLCAACAYKLAGAGIRVQRRPGRTEKVDCGQCGKRRFGGVFEVEIEKPAAAAGHG